MLCSPVQETLDELMIAMDVPCPGDSIPQVLTLSSSTYILSTPPSAMCLGLGWDGIKVLLRAECSTVPFPHHLMQL